MRLHIVHAGFVADIPGDVVLLSMPKSLHHAADPSPPAAHVETCDASEALPGMHQPPRRAVEFECWQR